MNIIELHAIVPKSWKIQTLNHNNCETHSNVWIPQENQEIHQNYIIPIENHKQYKNHKIPLENDENH